MKFLKKLFKKQNYAEFMISVDENVRYFETWEAVQRERKEAKVKDGVKSLREGRTVMVSNFNGDGLELALAIKKQFIFEETQKLNKWIQIDGMNDIQITFKPTQDESNN